MQVSEVDIKITQQLQRSYITERGKPDSTLTAPHSARIYCIPALNPQNRNNKSNLRYQFNLFQLLKHPKLSVSVNIFNELS